MKNQNELESKITNEIENNAFLFGKNFGIAFQVDFKFFRNH